MQLLTVQLILLGLPSDSRLTISRPEEAWSTKIVLVAENKNFTGSGKVTQSVTDRSLTAGLWGNIEH